MRECRVTLRQPALRACIYLIFIKLIFKEIINDDECPTNFSQVFLMTVVMFSLTTVSSHAAESAEDLNREATQALQSLLKSNSIAAEFSKIAKAVIVFPNIVKAGLVFGGSYGEGVLMKMALLQVIIIR